MGRLIYSVIGSLDGYMADRDGGFDWAVPDEEVLAFVNEQERGVGTYLYGRRIYDLMTGWEDDPAAAAQSPESGTFATTWQAARKFVYSTTLAHVTTRATELRRDFDPEEVARIKQDASVDLHVAGPTLARHAFAAGLVDELQVITVPALVGGGLAIWPAERLDLVLTGSRAFGSGAVDPLRRRAPLTHRTVSWRAASRWRG